MITEEMARKQLETLRIIGGGSLRFIVDRLLSADSSREEQRQ